MLVKINHGEILRKLLIYHNKKIQNSNMIRMIRMYSVEPNPILYILRSKKCLPPVGRLYKQICSSVPKVLRLGRSRERLFQTLITPLLFQHLYYNIFHSFLLKGIRTNQITMVLFTYVIEKMKTKVIGNARSAIARGDV